MEAGECKADAFQELKTEMILEAVETCGMRCTGRLVQLNSMENRVFAVEIENEDPKIKPIQVIVKFYRPGRWTPDQILSEHTMQMVLADENIPTPRFHPIKSASHRVQGTVPLAKRVKEELLSRVTLVDTLGKIGPFFYCVWHKVSGRAPLELSEINLVDIGSIVGRMHNLFESYIDPTTFSRHSLTTKIFGETALERLEKWGGVPRFLQTPVFQLATDLVQGLEWINTAIDFVPVHGDLHRLNLMQVEDAGNFWLVDFDDCMWAPDIHDLWLLASGVDLAVEEGQDSADKALSLLVQGYEKFRFLPQDSDLLVEPLRTLRMIYYYGWIAGRWGDPLFKDVFSFFKEPDYWERALYDLEQQREKLLLKGLLY
jgi:Ser/Thr protein kinase RdoA (MazF antagonist)